MINKSKYGSSKVVCDGLKFDSKLECEFYKLLIKSNIPFQRQVKFILQPKFKLQNKAVREITYIADFVICDDVIDIKGIETTDFKIKKKMFAFKYQKEIILLKSKKEMFDYIKKYEKVGNNCLDKTTKKCENC